MNPWLVLTIAGLLEVAWAVGLKYTEGFTKFWPSLGTVLAMGASFFLLAKTLRTIPIGTAYAVWTGIGAVGTVLLGMLFFGESRDVARLVFLMLIIGGIIGLRAVSHH